MLQILEDIIYIIIDASNYLIPIERYKLSTELVYISRNGVKIMFEPIDENNSTEADFNSYILEFLSDVDVERDICVQYLERVKTKIKEENPSRRGLLNYIGELKREIYICGWE